MRFTKNVSKDVQELLLEELKEYESSFQMTKKERQALHEWVASGHSPYTNDYNYCIGGGYPIDFVSAMREWGEQDAWFNSLSEEEKLIEMGKITPIYDTENDDIYYPTTDISGDMPYELPFK